MDAHLNPIAVVIGLTYGAAAAAGGYYVSQLAAGLFARPFYRIYARVLIGICAVMMVSPALRLVASWPIAAHLVLMVADYAVMLVLGYGIILFNRKYLAKLSVDRPVVVYFTFGTLAYAALATLVMLQVSARLDAGTTGVDRAPIVAGHYAPLIMILAGLVFHTDHYLKRASRSVRQFSGFTFVGYAISFAAIGLSLMPYFSNVLASLGWRPHERLLLTNFSSAQTLLLAILIYGALVWYRDSIPPLYLMLLAICGEYFVLVTQWLIRDDLLGPIATGLVSLPLVIGLDTLAHYFLAWDHKHQQRLDRQLGRDEAEQVAGARPRLVTPFVVISSLLVTGLTLFTIWVRVGTLTPSSPMWLAVTLVAYAMYYLLATVVRRQPRSIYAAGGLLAVAAIFGTQPIGSAATVLWLALASVVWMTVATISGRVGLKSNYRSALADTGLVTATAGLGLIAGRLVWAFSTLGPPSLVLENLIHYRADSTTALALSLLAVALTMASWLYGSRLPIYGALGALAGIGLELTPAIGLLAVVAADGLRRWFAGPKSRFAVEPLRVAERWLLPAQDSAPELFAAPLTTGTLPISLLGLLVGVCHIQLSGLFGSISTAVTRPAPWSAVAGLMISALVLGLFTRQRRWPALYVVAVAAGYFGIHSAVQAVAPRTPQLPDLHLLVAAMISMAAWLLATGYAIWCGLLIERVAETKEAEYRDRRDFYGGLTVHLTTLASIVALGLVAGRVLVPGWPASSGGSPSPVWLAPAGVLLAIQLTLAGSLYGSQLLSYLALAAVSLVTWSVAGFVHPAIGGPSNPTEITRSLALQGLALAMCLLANRWRQRPTATSQPRRWVTLARPWSGSLLPLPAEHIGLWPYPLVHTALALTACALAVTGDSIHQPLRDLSGPSERWLQLQIPTLAVISITLAAVTLLLGTRVYRQAILYVVAIATSFVAVHSAVQSYGLYCLPAVVAGAGHLLLLSLLSAVAWSTAAGLSRWWQALSRRVSAEREIALRSNDEFYAGILRQFALATTIVGLILTGLLTVAQQDLTTGSGRPFPLSSAASWTTTATGLVLAVLLAWQSIQYSQQLLVYLSVIATGVAGYAAVTAVVPVDAWQTADGLMLATIGLITSAASVAASLNVRGVQPTMLNEAGGRPSGAQSGAQSDSPSEDQSRSQIASTFGDLVTQPLELMSAALAGIAVMHTVTGWGEINPVWTVVTLIGAAVIWLVGTELSLRGRWQPFNQLAHQLYVCSILAAFAAVHVAWIGYAATQNDRTPSALAMHVVIQGVLALGGWSLAAVLAKRLSTSGVSTSGVLTSGLLTGASPDTRRLTLYAGLLNDTLLASGVASLLGLMVVVWTAEVLPSYSVMASVVLLALFFAGSASTYRSQVGSYLTLVTLGIGFFCLLQITGLLVPANAAPTATIVALAGLAAMTLAATALSPASVPDAGRPISRIPSPWPTPRLPLSVTSFAQLWQIPVVVASATLTVIGLLLNGLAIMFALVITFGPEARPTWYLTAVPAIAAATAWTAASIFRSRALSYVGTACLVLAAYPLGAIYGMTPMQVGPWLAGLSIGLWLASFVIERSLKRRRTSDQVTAERKLILAEVYERPLVRGGSLCALIALAHSLMNSAQSGWSAESGNLFLTSGLAAVTLLLAARTMLLLQLINRARLLVYLGTLAACACWIVAGLSWWGVHGIPWSAAGLSLVLALLGLILVESAQRSRWPALQGLLQLFGPPIAAVARWIPPLAISLAVVTRADDAPWPVLGWALSAASLVYLLSVRATGHVGWLHPAVISASVAVEYVVAEVWGLTPAMVIFTSIVMMHGLLSVGWLVRSRRAQISAWLGLGEVECERAFYEWPMVVGMIGAIAQTYYLIRMLDERPVPASPFWAWPTAAMLTAWLFLRVAKLRWREWLPHLAIATSLVGLFLIAGSTLWRITPDLVLLTGGLLWGSLASSTVRSAARPNWLARALVGTESLGKFAVATLFWAIGLCLLAVVLTVPCSVLQEPPYPTTSITWLATALACAWWGYRWHRGPVPGAEVDVSTLVPKDFDWLRAAVIAETLAALLMLLGVTAGLWYWNGSPGIHPTSTVIQWSGQTGLAVSMLAACFLWLTSQFRSSAHPEAVTASFLQQTAEALSGVSVLAVIAATALVVPTMSMHTLWPAANLALLACCWIYLAWTNQHEPAVYMALAAVAGVALYSRYQLLDVSWQRAYDSSFGVVGASFLAFGVYTILARQSSPRLQLFRRPMLVFALAAPLALLLTTPLQWHDWRVSMVIFSTGALYSVIAHWSKFSQAEYLAAVLYNVGIYLWIPTASSSLNLLQLYVIPAAFTVLVLAQLHRHDLNHRTLTSIRLAATSAILAVSTFDALFSSSTQNFPQFILVLTLSLLSIAAGIATYVRPFVFAGVAFLMVNVLGQLGLQFHLTHDGALRATILIGLGLAVIGLMIFFNIRREQILKRYHYFLTDPRWE
ncbi:MAG: hypothetical protein U0795_01775 [Pirellulales bacterium]